MIWKVYKHPKKSGDEALLTLRFEPSPDYVAILANKYGNIEVVEEDEVKNFNENKK